MTTILLLALLSAPDWRTREAADRALTGRPLPAQPTESAEAEARLTKHRRAAVWKRLDGLLGDAPFWPDCDFTTWLDWWTTDPLWLSMPSLRRPPYGTYDPGPYPFPGCRVVTREAIFEYLLTGGTEAFAKQMLASASQREALNGNTDLVREHLQWTRPDLLSESIRKRPWLAPSPRCKPEGGS